MLIDELKLHIKAGRGGNGVVRWRHEKGRDMAGPGGGNGGKGSDVLVEAFRDISLLASYKHLKEIAGEDGQSGMRNGMHGRDGEDLIIKLPVGTILTNLETEEKFSLEKEGQIIKILHGGKKGLGNEVFKSSVNVSPQESTEGKLGEEADFLIELELIADAGLIGLPNAGKTSLLNSLTNARHKVGDYPFTTLEPNLGALYGYVLADIPGLIEDSAKGKGLGIKFLKHIKRTKILLHCVSLENPDVIKAYKTIRKELKGYKDDLVNKDEYIILTKTDLVDENALKSTIKNLKAEIPSINIFTSSILDENALNKLKTTIMELLKKRAN
ncbi:MAG: Obg family GTPase CgtA [Patescibacteria group bacterium]